MPRMSKESIVEELLGENVLPIEKSTRDLVKSLNISDDKHKLALAALAFRLARKLDRDAGMATAAIAKELRETLSTIAESDASDADFWKYFGASGLPSEIRNS